ncbi:MAG: mechanosensitive ion channel [Anaerolineae bacterium]|nr:mechanosensitive ion channel [Anaerolineae bacterium]
MDPSQILSQLLAAAGVSAAQLPSDVDLSPGNILRAIVILIVVYFVARLARSVIRRLLDRSGMDPGVKLVLLQLAFYSIIGLGVIWVLGGFGLSVLLLGIAAGFALKDLIQNFAAGLLIMGTRPFQPGDWIAIGPSEGIVAEVSWRGTFLDTFDGRRVIVPNSSIITSVVVNNSLSPQLRSTLSLSVDLQSDFERVREQILDALKPIRGISENPPPRVLIESLTGRAANLKISFWVQDPVNNQNRVVSETFDAVKRALPASVLDLVPVTTATPPRDDKPK